MKHVFISTLVTALTGTACMRDQAAPDENYPSSAETSPAKAPKGRVYDAKQNEERRELIQYVLRLSDASNPFTAEDRVVFNQLSPNPAAGSFQEAAAVIGAIRLSLDASNQPQFQEQDLKNPSHPNTPAPATTPAEASLEEVTKAKGVAIAQALERNIIIKTVKVYRLTMEALQKTKNSQGFHDSVSSVIQNEAKEWAALVQAPTTVVTPADTGSAATPEQPKTGYSPADLRQGDATLAEADRLADEGSYKEAIAVAAGIVPADPFHESAQEKIKMFSNRAVQSLRQKAAAAYQSAQPAQNSREKAVFLQEARKYLEEALTDYPKAEHLDTVRENLGVITQNIEKLGTSTR